jgi:quercetin dioxygenase-like cupin family protein
MDGVMLEKTGNEAELKPFEGPTSPDAMAEIFIQNSYSGDNEQLWVPLAENRWSRPLCLNVSQGYWVHLTRFRGSGVISCHRHPAPVHGFVMQGSWRYLEHDWVAGPGSYIFEPPGDVHTLVAEDTGEDSITLFHMTGALIYCDEKGNTTGYEDVFTRIEAYRAHYEKIGLGGDYVKNFIR